MIFTIFCFSIASFNEDFKTSYIITYIPGMILGTAFPFLFGRHFPKLIERVINQGKLNNKFKQIFDKLDESIIIMNTNDKIITYVNDYFYHQFKDIVSKIPDQDEPLL